MTLTPAQWDRIYAGIPCQFDSGSRLAKFRSQQFVKVPKYPLVIVSITTQGIPVSSVKLLRYNSVVKSRETWGQNCKARITAIIEALDITECESLASQFYQVLYTNELGLTPYGDRMQFRGADPPQNLPPYYNDKKRKMVQRFGVDFFVEYEFSWQKNFDTIQKVILSVGDEEESSVFDWDEVKQSHSVSYLLDVIIVS
jgi:hypothetical protein